jgi:hypothetical protein
MESDVKQPFGPGPDEGIQRGLSSFLFHPLTSSTSMFHLAISVIISFFFSTGPLYMLNTYRIFTIITTSYSSGFATSVCVFTTVDLLLPDL